VSADSRSEAAPIPRDGASRLKFGTGRSPSLQQGREGGQSKIRDRSDNPTAYGCMHVQIQPARARVGAPDGERAPRDRRCRAHRAFGANPFVLIGGLTAVSADSRGEAAPFPRDGASRLKFGTGRSPSLQQVFRRKLPLLFSARESREGGQSKIRDRSEDPTACGRMYVQIQPARARFWEGEGGQLKILDRSVNPTACGCMYFQIQPARARVGAPEGERAPRDRRCRAHRAFGANPSFSLEG